MTREETQNLLAMMQAAYQNYNPPSKTAAVNVWHMMLQSEKIPADFLHLLGRSSKKSNC